MMLLGGFTVPFGSLLFGFLLLCFHGLSELQAWALIVILELVLEFWGN